MHCIVGLLLKDANFALIAICFGSVLVMWRKNLLREFPLAVALLLTQGVLSTIGMLILFYFRSLGIKIDVAYDVFFWSGWIGCLVESILRIVIIYSVFRLALQPLQGLQNIGKIIFRWVAAVSIAIAVGIAAGPHAASGYGMSTAVVFTRIISQGQQAVCILTLCLLLFVCFATKPLGLTYRSRAFGLTLGLGVLATVDLVQAAWLATNVARSVYSPIFLFSTVGFCAGFGVWGAYFALPEPERRMILLPTTSPFFFWNRISEALGADPGHVVIAGFHPDMLAAAEIDMFSAPTLSHSTAPELIVERSLPALRSAAQH